MCVWYKYLSAYIDIANPPLTTIHLLKLKFTLVPILFPIDVSVIASMILCGALNEHLLTADRKSMADQNKGSIKV